MRRGCYSCVAEAWAGTPTMARYTKSMDCLWCTTALDSAATLMMDEAYALPVMETLMKDAVGDLLFVGDPGQKVSSEGVSLPGGGIRSRAAHTGAPHECHALHRRSCIQSRAGDGSSHSMLGTARAAQALLCSQSLASSQLHGTLHSRQGRR